MVSLEVRMQPLAGSQSLDRNDRFPGRGAHRRYTRDDRLAVQQHRAGPALAFAASIFRARESQIFPEHVQQ